MLIVYRTNPGFEGQIVTLDRTTLAAEMDAHIAQSEKGGDVAYIQVAEKMLDPAVLVGLTRNPELYRVVGGVLTKGGQPVALGYSVAKQETALSELKNDLTIRKFFTLTDAQLRTYLGTMTWQDAIVTLRSIIVKICRAAGLTE
mgnify:CR=1 FL=1